MDYAGADSLLVAAIPPKEPAHAYFRGLCLFNRFNDLGDTAALTQAARLWEGLDRDPGKNPPPVSSQGNLPLYRGLATLQLSYVAKIRGHSLAAARLGRRAAGQLRPHSGDAEAEAALALYDYYKAGLLKGMDWLPFIRSDSEGSLRRLEKAIPRSRYLSEVLQTSLVWIYYDAGQYDKGLDLIGPFLVRYPQNRVYRQIKADFLFRKGQFPQALAIHRELLSEYGQLREHYPPPGYIPVGYLSSVGNLAKIYTAMGMADSAKTQVRIWSAPQSLAYQAWLPASLKKEVKTLPTP